MIRLQHIGHMEDWYCIILVGGEPMATLAWFLSGAWRSA